jgi:ribosomal protein S18 acetylase RimI-like enzyme
LQTQVLGPDYEVRAGLKRLLGLATDADVHHVAAWSGKAVVGGATAMVTADGRTVSVWGVCTAPGYERRGIGRAVTVAACRAAGRRGARTVVLAATPSGEGLYRRMGFTAAGFLISAVARPDGPPSAGPP